MSSKPDQLDVASWTLDRDLGAVLLTEFMLSETSHDLLAQWNPRAIRSNAPTFPGVVLAGLSEMLAFFAPEIAYMDSRARYSSGRPGLALYILGDVETPRALRTRIEAAINFWLTTIYPGKTAELRMKIAADALDDANWRTLEISAAMNDHSGVCASPADRRAYAAFLASAVSILRVAKVEFASGDSRTLIAQTPQSGLFDGVKLIAFPPKRSPNGEGLYTEVITLRAATFPERKREGLHLLAQPSLRNWGPIKNYDLSKDPARSLDLFMPPRSGGDGFAGYSHSRFKFKARVMNWDGVHHRHEEKVIEARWESQSEKSIFDIVRKLVGAAPLSNADLMAPVIDYEGAWILPQLAPGSGDRFLAGGSGLGWSDRNDIAESVGKGLAEHGFVRSTPMQRTIGRMAIHSEYAKGGDEKKRRALLRKAIVANGGVDTLIFVILHVREDTPLLAVKEIERLLGEPEVKEGSTYRWSDGLKLEVLTAPADCFGRLLPSADTPSRALEGKSDAQAVKIKDAMQSQKNKEAEIEMARYLASLIESVPGVGCALVEMPASIKGHFLDPYRLGRQSIAHHNLLPKIVLDDDDIDEKFRGAVEDCFRMLGVSPFLAPEDMPQPSAIGIVQKNQTGEISATTSQSLPVAVRLRDDVVQAALPTPTFDPAWRPYARALLDILTGEYERLSRRRTPENLGLHQHFVRTALEQLNRLGESIVFVDGERLRSSITALQNQNLKFDELELEGTVFVPASLPNIRIVRVNANAKELPSYSHNKETQWTSGLFRWDDATRTFYGAKKKPVTAKKDARALLQSRHSEDFNEKTDRKHRKAALLDELCLIFKQPGDDAERILLLAHRLRSHHIQYGDDTRLPFPLHELQAFSKAVSS